MQQSLVLYSGLFAAQQKFGSEHYNTSAVSGDQNMQFFKQTFQQPLQYGLPGYGQPISAAVEKHSSASTNPWPSDEYYVNSSNGCIPVAQESLTIADMLPIQSYQQLIQLENRIVSAQQYECLISHLQVLTIRHNGTLGDMLRNFIADQVLGRIGFARTKNGKYDCAMRSDLQRIMMAIKASWFPAQDQNTFELQMAQLLKNAHSRCKSKPGDTIEGPVVASPASSKDQEAPHDVEDKSRVPTQSAPQSDLQCLQNQWYRYAIYYRDRYQIARKANQKMKTDYTEQEKDYKKRISVCLKRVRIMERYMDALEQRVRSLERR
ncbi:uncharacterized protein LOC134220437 [Armigeres subalbatus]|uniref:uncharacterized protein LOC134220437 n=1 Tax=Armigeres subalbatus TaxID=124917 RepID=UPI002ED6A104